MTTFIATLEHIECGVQGCGVYFGISPALHKKMLEEGWHVYCPNGHYISYTKTELQKAQDALAREKHRAEQLGADRDRWRGEARHQQQRAKVLKGHHTRLKRRVAHGVCPCCRRSFANLARHMTTKHAGYVENARA